MPSLNTLMDGLLKEIQCATCAEIPGDEASPLPGREAVSRTTMIETRLVGGRHVDGAACVDLLKNIGRMLRALKRETFTKNVA